VTILAGREKFLELFDTFNRVKELDPNIDV